MSALCLFATPVLRTIDISTYSPSDQEFLRLVADRENMEQAEAAESPASPQPTSTAVPTDGL